MAAPRFLVPLLPAVLLGGLALVGARAGTVAGAPATSAPAPLSAVAELGRQMFSDPRLSGSGVMSCASCHDPANHFAPSNGLVVQIGGPGMDQPGFRTTPTLTYKSTTPPFTIGAEDPSSEAGEAAPIQLAQTSDQIGNDGVNAFARLAATQTRVANLAPGAPKSGDTSAAPVARGGLFWDGRADTLEEQAMGPLLSPFEMANTRHSLYQTIRTAYGDQLGRLFGAQILSDEKQTLDEAAFALGRFQVEDPAFHSFDSKYDAYLAGHATLSPAEARGLKLFDDPKKGNCAACHLDQPGKDGAPPLFTDFEFEALGLPRNPAIPANADPHYYDLGLCGPLRSDQYARAAPNCGLFKTPDPAQCRDPRGVLPQWRLQQADRGDPLLCPARYPAGTGLSGGTRRTPGAVQ